MKWDNCKTVKPERTEKAKRKVYIFFILMVCTEWTKNKKICKNQKILTKSLFFTRFQCQEG